MKKRGTGGFLRPEQTLKQLDIHDGIAVADFGSGRGYFSIPMAKINPNGTVYAVDVIEEALQAVRAKAKLEKIFNIQTIRANLEVLGGSKLDDQSIDLVILANILFQTKNKKDILKEVKRVLKNGGKVAIIDWIEGVAMAPKEGWLISKEEAQQLAEETGFDLDKELEVDEHHFGLLFTSS